MKDLSRSLTDQEYSITLKSVPVVKYYSMVGFLVC